MNIYTYDAGRSSTTSHGNTGPPWAPSARGTRRRPRARRPGAGGRRRRRRRAAPAEPSSDTSPGRAASASRERRGGQRGWFARVVQEGEIRVGDEIFAEAPDGPPAKKQRKISSYF